MDYLGLHALFHLLIIIHDTGFVISDTLHHVSGVEGHAVILSAPVAEGTEVRSIDWRYRRLHVESKIASFIHGHITTDEDDHFSSRLLLNTTAFFLKIEPLHLEDSGQYVAEIFLKNAHKYIQSFNLTVYVNISNVFLKKTSESTDCLPENSEKWTNISSQQNCSFILECWVEKGNHITFYWQKNGTNVTDGISKCSSYSYCSLLEAPIMEYCSTSYSCTANNAVSTKTRYIVACFTGQLTWDHNGSIHISGLIIGIIVLFVVVLIIILLICLKIIKKRKRSSISEYENWIPLRNNRVKEKDRRQSAAYKELQKRGPQV
ncbi:SLAM family member 9-like isoform X2 [Protopterus annectens]|uniref:SLAM family member 9-like isoform X2 n=1 Tax=Protopterus annectens TaxID=7888 RepID=UPI001CF9D4E5|nr:SLAM family member 9-like isoform X2 [Protopterus annectens]